MLRGLLVLNSNLFQVSLQGIRLYWNAPHDFLGIKRHEETRHVKRLIDNSTTSSEKGLSFDWFPFLATEGEDGDAVGIPLQSDSWIWPVRIKTGVISFSVPLAQWLVKESHLSYCTEYILRNITLEHAAFSLCACSTVQHCAVKREHGGLRRDKHVSKGSWTSFQGNTLTSKVFVTKVNWTPALCLLKSIIFVLITL